MKQPFLMAGLIGWPVAHSRSPAIHNYWLKHYGISGAYGLFPVTPGSLTNAINGLKALGLAGCNVTLPHKVEAMKLMDYVDPVAKKMGAINTIVHTLDGALHGFNHDGNGYIQSLRDANALWRADTGPVTLLGAGGAARAVVLSLLNEGAQEIRLVNRTKDKALVLAEEMGPKVVVVDWNDRHDALDQAVLLINTTSLGMQGKEVLELNLSKLPERALVSDAIYIPLETELLKAARLRGHTTVNGLGMLLNQARFGFNAWFGVSPEITPELHQAVLATF